MVGLGSLGSLAQSAVKNFSGDESNKETKESNTGSGDNQWADVGASAKKAFTDYQDSQKKGEKVNYSEIGQVAQQAQKAYSSSEGPKDATTIGKAVVSGFLGKDNPENEQRSVESSREDRLDNERCSDNERRSNTESRPMGGSERGRDSDERRTMQEQRSTGNNLENRSESGNYSGNASFGRESGNAGFGRDSGNISYGRDSGTRDEVRPLGGDNRVGQGVSGGSSGSGYKTQDEGSRGNFEDGNGSSRRN